MTSRTLLVEYSPDRTANERRWKTRAAAPHPCFGGCGALIRAAFKYCRPCSDMACAERHAIRAIEKRRNARART